MVVWGREQSEVERKESEPRQALYWGAAKEERRSRLRPMPKIAGSAVIGLARAGVAVLTRSQIAGRGESAEQYQSLRASIGEQAKGFSQIAHLCAQFLLV